MQQQFILYILHPWIRFYYLCPFCDKVYILHDIAPLNQILLSVSILWQGLYSTWYCALESDSIICVHSVTRFIFYVILRPWIRFYYLCPFCDKVYILRDIAPLNQNLLSVSILWQGHKTGHFVNIIWHSFWISIGAVVKDKFLDGLFNSVTLHGTLLLAQVHVRPRQVHVEDDTETGHDAQHHHTHEALAETL